MPSTTVHPLVRRCFEGAGIDPSTLSGSGSVLRSPTAAYFAKHARGAAAARQMAGEAASLRAMAQTAPHLVPRVVGFVEDAGGAGMVSEYFDLGRAGDQAALGRAVAEMHRVPEGADGGGGAGADDALADEPWAYTGRYGFGCATHCGATAQANAWADDWASFYREQRLGDLVRRIADGQISAEWETLCARAVPLLLDQFEPAPRPVVLHGDLWSGNVGADRATGRPVVFDPSSYYGHNEADLGITHMFGGFSQAFYDAYHAVHPRSAPYYDERQKLYELYHHLNHTLMFGGSYKSGALGIMRGLSAWADGVEA